MAQLTDTQAVNRICAVLDGKEWDADTVDIIAEIVRDTGRVVRDLDNEEVES